MSDPVNDSASTVNSSVENLNPTVPQVDSSVNNSPQSLAHYLCIHIPAPMMSRASEAMRLQDILNIHYQNGYRLKLATSKHMFLEREAASKDDNIQIASDAEKLLTRLSQLIFSVKESLDVHGLGGVLMQHEEEIMLIGALHAQIAAQLGR